MPSTSRIRVHLPACLLAAVLEVVEKHGFANTVDLHIHPEASEAREVASESDTKECGVQATDYFYVGDNEHLETEVQSSEHGWCSDIGLQDGGIGLSPRRACSYIGDREDLLIEAQSAADGLSEDPGQHGGGIEVPPEALLVPNQRQQDAEERSFGVLPAIPPLPDYCSTAMDDCGWFDAGEYSPSCMTPATLPRPPDDGTSGENWQWSRLHWRPKEGHANQGRRAMLIEQARAAAELIRRNKTATRAPVRLLHSSARPSMGTLERLEAARDHLRRQHTGVCGVGAEG